MTLIEGASLITLILIAVPLKYLAGLPVAVKIVGPIHGALFLWTMGVLALAILRSHLPALKGAGVFVAALIPFGGLWSHRMLARAVAAYAGR
jgi:integral membrane protein